MTTKEIKELALQILNRNGETGIKKSDFTVRQAKQLIKEYNLGWMKQKGKKKMTNMNKREYSALMSAVDEIMEGRTVKIFKNIEKGLR